MLPTISRREWVWVVLVAALIMALTLVPYLAGLVLTPAGYRFSGFVINPIDGHSYLAKMGQGAAGAWLFRIPYTSELHEPVFIFTYHLLLGHLIPGGEPIALVWLYHLARVVWGGLLLLAVYAATALISDRTRVRRLALLLVGLASGIGWLVGGGPDLMVPESITFASLLVNAHFGLTVLLMLLAIIGMTVAPPHWGWWPVLLLASAWLTMIQPFAVLVVGLAAGGWHLIGALRARRIEWGAWLRLAPFLMAALPLGLYFVLMTRGNAQIAAWMDQNVTPSPPWWEWLVGYGLLWPLALCGAWRSLKRGAPGDRLLLCWAGAQLGLMLLPISLQRRLSTGLHLPLCLLAAGGLDALLSRLHTAGRRRLLVLGLLLVMFPSNLLLMMAGVNGVMTRNPYVVMSEDQATVLQWLRQELEPGSVVLADETFGTLVPGWGGGARVVYGHPFETLEAETRRAEVADFFAGRLAGRERDEWLESMRVQAIVVQHTLGQQPVLPAAFQPVLSAGGVTVYLRGDR